MSLALQAAGHDVAVLAGLAPSGLLTWRNRIARKLHSEGAFPADRALATLSFGAGSRSRPWTR